jgi:hypothetical protein
VRISILLVGFVTACSTSTVAIPAASAAHVPPPQITQISACAGPNAEVEEATAPPDYVYVDWIGCGGIGFAMSADGGKTWGPATAVPGSVGPAHTAASSWDPAITVGRDGTVYASFMYSTGVGHGYTYPVVDVSTDHGASFVHSFIDKQNLGNWGDRDFIAAAPDGKLYLTWDYAPTASKLKLQCAKIGSCYFTAGELNAVMQVSRDGGQTWSKIVPVQPGYPAGGADSAPLLVNPRTGKVDVLFEGHKTDPGTLKLHPGTEFFTSSSDGTHWPARPAAVRADAGTTPLSDWWIDGAISADAAGNLYATWDTLTPHGDVGWLSVSINQGRTWSTAMRVTPDSTDQPHIIQSAAGRPGVAYIGWLTSAPAKGYALFIRAYSHGRLGPIRQVSAKFGSPSIWPGDTFGIAILPNGALSLTWGSAVPPSKASQIYAATIMMR